MRRLAPLACLARLALAALLAACGSGSPAGRTTPTAALALGARTVTATAPVPSSSSSSNAVGVSVDVRAPLRARYDPTLTGAARPSLAVVVTNRSARPLDVSDLRVHLEAARESVAFRCAKEVGAQPGEREPTTLAPGESFVFDRSLDCVLPLVGAYAVRVAVAFGSGPLRIARDVQAFTLTVAALPEVEPREIDGVPGLWAALGSNSKLAGGVGRGNGHTLLTIVNATRSPIELPHLRLAVRVYKVGNPIPCVDEPRDLALPAVLAPGDAHYELVEVSCLGLAVAGTYDVAARLLVRRGTEGDHEIALGRLRIDVVTDPTLFIPPVW